MDIDVLVSLLDRGADDIAPSPPPIGQMVANVRRKRRHSHGFVAVAAASAVILFVGIAEGVNRYYRGTEPPALATHSSSFDDPHLWTDPLPGDCPQASKMFDPSAAPAIRDLDEQVALAASIKKAKWDSFTVRFTRPTALGLAVLVDGDVGRARELLGEKGLDLVGGYGDQDEKSGGIDPNYEVKLMVQAKIAPMVTQVNAAVEGEDGAGDIASWADAGAVLVLWKQPVPGVVKDLSAVRNPSGVKVIVQGANYSVRELDNAEAKLGRFFGAGLPATSLGRCGDDSGLVVGVRRHAFSENAAMLRKQYTAAAGVPVTVVAQDPASGLDRSQ